MKYMLNISPCAITSNAGSACVLSVFSRYTDSGDSLNCTLYNAHFPLYIVHRTVYKPFFEPICNIGNIAPFVEPPWDHRNPTY